MKKEKTVPEIRIRNVNAAAVARIDQLAKESNFKSRNAYLRHYIETLSVIQDLQEQENRYAAMVSNISQVLENQNALLETMRLQLNRLEKKVNE